MPIGVWAVCAHFEACLTFCAHHLGDWCNGSTSRFGLEGRVSIALSPTKLNEKVYKLILVLCKWKLREGS